MKKIIYFILAGLFSCQGEKTPEAFFPRDQQEENVWMVYEGRVPLSDDSHLYMEVSMLPSDQIGEGAFQLKEFMETDGALIPISSFEGKYSTLYGETPGDQVIQFLHSAQEKGVKRSYLTSGFQSDFKNSQIRMIREELFRKTDLTVKVDGKNKLLVLDEHLRPLVLDPQFNLTRRLSKLFTIEGYFRHNGDTADFLEMNTRERWAVTKLGSYHQAIRQYHELTTEKFQVTYLKGIGYSIRHTNKAGKETEALVLKKILQMSAATGMTGEYNQLP